MSKPLTIDEAARRYAARVAYRKRLTSLIRRCRCSREEEADYDDYGRVCYPGAPSCWSMNEEERSRTLSDPFKDDGNGIPAQKGTWADWYDRYREARDGIVWCVRCLRREKLYAARKKAGIAERNAQRGLLNAVQREAIPEKGQK